MPTRTGYSFVGWRGRNLFPIDGWKNSLYVTFSQTSNGFEVSSSSSTSVTQKYICRDNFSLTKGTYYLSYGSYETTGEVDHPSIDVCQYESSGEYVGWSRVSETSNVTDTRQNTYFYLPNDDDNLQLVIYVSINASTKTGTVKVTDLMLTKVSSENEIVKYEPYYIESGTVFGTPGDRTLVAELTANSNNLFTNGDFEDVYTQTDTGWDNSINGTLHATGWGDYNSGITNPSTAVHAHIKDISSTDLQHGHVFEMIGAYRGYIATLYRFNSPDNYTSGVYRFSASVKGASGQNVLTAGLYHKKTSGDEYSFHLTRKGIRFGVTDDWFRITFTYYLSPMVSASQFYIYCNGWGVGEDEANVDISDITPSMNNIFYLDDVFLEKIA